MRPGRCRCTSLGRSLERALGVNWRAGLGLGCPFPRTKKCAELQSKDSGNGCPSSLWRALQRGRAHSPPHPTPPPNAQLSWRARAAPGAGQGLFNAYLPCMGDRLADHPTHIVQGQGSGVGHSRPSSHRGEVSSEPELLLACRLALHHFLLPLGSGKPRRPSHLPGFAPNSCVVGPALPSHCLGLSLQALSIFKDPSWKLSMVLVQSD